MNKTLIFILLLFAFQSCKVFEKNKDVIADYSKIVAKKTLQKIFGSEKLVFEKDSINIDAIISKEQAEKALGKKVSAFATKEGMIKAETQDFYFSLKWEVSQIDTSKRNLVLLYFRKR